MALALPAKRSAVVSAVASATVAVAAARDYREVIDKRNSPLPAYWPKSLLLLLLPLPLLALHLEEYQILRKCQIR